ncbi:unnamed protein product [Paramecium primaurelia]|uniref:Ubiquitin-like protease family profile domain-containing protein n=1 Tax=Paramecium primaurelia TaxID=5886 RepID=A0A8S1QDF2_PARPR|nr:unnamed protein product [Paramecium primaurelia]
MQQNQDDQKNETNDKSTIYKVHIGQSLILRPGGNIIILPTIQDNQPLLGYQCQIYLNQRYHISIPFDFIDKPDNFPAIYKGCIDQNKLLPNGKGEIHFNNDQKFFGQFKEGFADGICNINNNDYTLEYRWGWRHGPFEQKFENCKIKGSFKNNLLHGTLTEFNENGEMIEPQQYYLNNVRVEYPPQIENLIQTTRYLFDYKDYSINNYQFIGLNEYNWINQTIIDFYLELIQDYFRIINPDKTILLINTIMCQDIFSSMVSDISNQISIPQKIEELILQNIHNRIILIMNIDRSHFVTLVFQNNTLFLLNSMNYFLDNRILEKVIQIFPLSEKQIEMKILPVPQQQNGYDCGLYSIFNVLLQYINIDTPVDQIDYSIETPQKINYLRQHLRNVFLNDYAHLYPAY